MSSNLDLEKAIKDSGVKKWQVAKCLGVADTTFSRWLRDEMSAVKKMRVFEAIKQAKEKFKGE